MFLQEFQGGSLYKQGKIYVLKIDGAEFNGQTIEEVLIKYGSHKPIVSNGKSAKKTKPVKKK